MGELGFGEELAVFYVDFGADSLQDEGELGDGELIDKGARGFEARADGETMWAGGGL